MTFQIQGLPQGQYAHLIGLSDAELAAVGAVRRVVDKPVGFPCRVGLRDLSPGETAILLNHVHQPAPTPYQAAHAIFVGESSVEARPGPGEIPDVIARRPVSLRAFDAKGMMVGADLAEGREAQAAAIDRLLADPAAAYVDLHNAKPGCWAARALRAQSTA